MKITLTFLSLLCVLALADSTSSSDFDKGVKKFQKRMQGFEKEVTGKATAKEKAHPDSLNSQAAELQKSIKKALKKASE
ncbi:MAG: hypothetical protein HYZ71_09700 [Deltaproteobacteria bacterium]|nr:hypothetical protein [Deltaproteobacteria bacterium]